MCVLVLYGMGTHLARTCFKRGLKATWVNLKMKYTHQNTAIS